jgi:site-specific recombinase XerD
MASIYKRGGVWYIYYRVDGHKVRRRVSRSKKIAQLALSDVIVKLEKKQLGFAPPPKKHAKPIAEFLEEYRKYSETNHRDATVVRYGAIIDNFTRFLEERPEVVTLSDLSGKLFEEYKTYRREKPTTPNGLRKGKARKGAKANTVNMEIQTLRTILGLAIKWEYIKKNPVKGVPHLKVDDAKQPRFLTQVEARKLLTESAKVSRQLHDIYFTLLYTGMRKGELLNLTWNDIDLKRDKIKIQNKDFWKPKSGQREISMHKAVRTLLLRLKRENDGKSRFVFCDKDGGKLRRKLRRDFMEITKKCGFPDVTKLHSLRHTFGSQLVMAGVDLATVQQEMGHADISTTMIYSHLTPEHRQNAVNALQFGRPRPLQGPGGLEVARRRRSAAQA